MRIFNSYIFYQGKLNDTLGVPLNTCFHTVFIAFAHLHSHKANHLVVDMMAIFGCCKRQQNSHMRVNKVTFLLPDLITEQDSNKSFQGKKTEIFNSRNKATKVKTSNSKYIISFHRSAFVNNSDDDDDYDDLEDGAPPSDMEVGKMGNMGDVRSGAVLY